MDPAACPREPGPQSELHHKQQSGAGGQSRPWLPPHGPVAPGGVGAQSCLLRISGSRAQGSISGSELRLECGDQDGSVDGRTVLSGIGALPGQVPAGRSLTPRLPPGLGPCPSASVYTVESSLCPRPSRAASWEPPKTPGPSRGLVEPAVMKTIPPRHTILGTEKTAPGKCRRDSLTQTLLYDSGSSIPPEVTDLR